MSDYEPRNCFKTQAHDAHDWSVEARDGSTDNDGSPRWLWFSCNGHEARPAPWELKGPGDEDKVEVVTTPAILDGRTAYGDKVQNQVEQAAMINAYLSGRQVRPVDVPIIMILIKAHRIGKMPDYKDSYDDVEGYLSIAKSVIGPDMIEATTAREYMEIKNRGHQGEGRAIEGFGNPYRNIDQ